MMDQVIICSKNYPPGIDEFKEANLLPHPSPKVKTPGIEGCQAWAECTLTEEISRKNYSLIIGKVIHLEAYERWIMNAAEPLSVIPGSNGMRFTRLVFADRYVTNWDRGDPCHANICQ